jgi:endonuclease YncB( thermonuclease family)
MAEGRRLCALLLLLAAGGCDAFAVPARDGAREEAREPAGEPVAEARIVRPGSETVASGAAFACTPTKVWDGDGPIHCAEGPKVRLAGIAARETDGSCSPGHPCPDATAGAARDALAGLLGRTTGTTATGHVTIEGPALSCTSEGSAGGRRTAAWCVSPSAGDLSCAMVASGTAVKWDRYWRGHSCA